MNLPRMLQPVATAANSKMKPLLDRFETELEKGKYRAELAGTKALLRLYPGHVLGVEPGDSNAVAWAKRAVDEGHFRWIVEGQLIGQPGDRAKRSEGNA